MIVSGDKALYSRGPLSLVTRDGLEAVATPKFDRRETFSDYSLRNLPGMTIRAAEHFDTRDRLKHVGKGSTGHVYRAKLKADTVAFGLQANREGYAAIKHARLKDELVRQTMSRELSLLKEFGDHPSIVTYYGVSPDDPECADHVCIFMEFADSGNLRNFLLNKNFTMSSRLGTFRTVVKAIKALHDRGVQHRDIKADNVLLVGDCLGHKATCKAILCDLGSACTLSDGEWPPFEGENAGTPEYLSPSATRNPGEVSKHRDIWALGILFYELISGGRFPTEIQELAGWDQTAVAEDRAKELKSLLAKGFDITKDEHFNRILAAQQYEYQPLVKLLKGMLDLDEKTRISIDKVLQLTDELIWNLGYLDLLNPAKVQEVAKVSQEALEGDDRINVTAVLDSGEKPPIELAPFFRQVMVKHSIVDSVSEYSRQSLMDTLRP